MKDFEAQDESSIWPWVTGIVVLAMVIWVAAELSTGDMSTDAADDGAVITTQTRPRPAPAPGVDSVIAPGAFSAWVRDSAAAVEWSGDGGFVQAALGRLAATLGNLAPRSESPELQERAAALQRTVAGHDSAATASVDSVRAVLLEAGAIAMELHGHLSPGDDTHDITEAVEAANELDAEQPLQRQRHRVHRYLDFMAQSLMKLAPP